MIAFKKRRRKNSRRKRGYRHEFSVVRITEILTAGQEALRNAAPRPKREAKAKAGSFEAEAKAAKTEAAKESGGQENRRKGRSRHKAAKKPAAKGTKK